MVVKGVAAKMVGVATTTTDAGMTAVVEASKRIGCWYGSGRRRGGNVGRNNRGGGRSSGRGKRRAEERCERTFSVGRLVNLLPLAVGLEHGPRRGDRGSTQQVSRAMVG